MYGDKWGEMYGYKWRWQINRDPIPEEIKT